MARERTLTEKELNRALLGRQLLLERSGASIPKVLERMGRLQAQYAPSMYIGLWSRIEGFEREQLDGALERPSVAQGTLMRATIHLVSKADYWPMAIGIRRSRREAWVDARAKRGYSAKQASSAARKLRGPPRRRHDEPQSDSRAARLGQRHHQRRQHLARPRSGAALRHLGSPPRGPLRGGGALAGQTAGQARRGAGHRAAGQALPGRLRSLDARRDRAIGRVCRPTGWRRCWSG